jgi:hypothetical protein
LEQTGVFSEDSNPNTDANEVEISIPCVNGENKSDIIGEGEQLNSVGMSKEL